MKPFDELSARQRKMLRFIDEFTAERGYPPSIREIGDATQTNSTSVVNYNLQKLVDAEYITRDGKVSRGVRLIARIPNGKSHQIRGIAGEGSSSLVPMIGVIAAGEPIPVPETIGQVLDEDDMIEVTTVMLGNVNPADVFALRVKGDSMIDAMIADGDIVLFRRQTLANPGDMVAVWLPDHGETTLKHYYPEKDKIRLQPAHPHMEPIFVDAANCQIHGKVVSVIRRLR